MNRLARFLTPVLTGLALSASALVGPVQASAATIPVNEVQTIDVTTPTVWSVRGAELGFTGYRRHCSSVNPANVTYSGAGATLKLTKEYSKTNIAKAKAAGCPSKLVKKKKVYQSIAVDTEDSIRIRSGRVEAKVKFSSITGVNAAVWLQSANGGPEIDMIESYGNRITNVYHTRTSSGGTKEHKVYNKKMSKSWYKKWHTFAVEFDSNTIRFYVDGKLTSRGSGLALPPSAEYFLVMSVGAADWQLKSKTPHKTPAAMTVQSIKVTATS